MKTNPFKKELDISREEVNNCFAFAHELYTLKAASTKQFGRKDIIRDKNDFIADHVIGKVVEYGFQHFLEENFNISFRVDFEIWNDPHIHDNGHDMSTIIVNKEKRTFQFKTDIKGSRSSSQWLLVEKQKITDFGTQIYVIGILKGIPEGKEFEENPYKFIDHDWKVSILGYALNRDLVDPITRRGWIEYKKGEKLYNPWILENLEGKNRSNNLNNKKYSHSEFQHELLNILKNPTRGAKQYIGGTLDANVNYGLPIQWLRNSPEDWYKFEKILHVYSK
ncbi:MULTISPECIES: hypothetical protein [unclassified Exiguobacterium]|uniref:hypothetical protein n=1 Tax=unclassified Exiguobacterium TaxID=2644629 RepID=UPI001BE5F2CA|nr:MULTISPECIES: hypothetical protein [unclassified Exiguobacterium]